MLGFADHEVRAPLGANVLADWPSKFSLRLGPGKTKRGVVLVEARSRPIVEGHIHLCPLSLAEVGVEHELVYPVGHRGRMAPNVLRLEVGQDGVFRGYCETPEGPVVMRATQRGAVLHEETFDAVTDGRSSRILRLP